MMAPATAATSTCHSDTRCWEASTPPSTTAVSPGNTKPTNADASSIGRPNTRARACHPPRLERRWARKAMDGCEPTVHRGWRPFPPGTLLRVSEPGQRDSPFPPEEASDRVVGGRYRLISRIASGGMAEVWKAYDELLARPVAIKFPLEHLRRLPEFSARFQREAVAGHSLRQLLSSRGKLPVAQAVAVAAEVATALDFAHRKGIIHRDIKPANVLIADGVVKVADFGIAKAAMGDDLTKTSLMLGTARYCSPEQVEGASLDARSDIYSLGVLLYEMVCGCPPFDAESEVALALKHVTTEPVPPSRHCPVPGWLEEVIQTAMRKQPDQRFRTAAAMRRALAERGVTDSPAPPPAPLGQAGAATLADEPTGLMSRPFDDVEDATVAAAPWPQAGAPSGGPGSGAAEPTPAGAWVPYSQAAAADAAQRGQAVLEDDRRPGGGSVPDSDAHQRRMGPIVLIVATGAVLVAAIVAATLATRQHGSAPGGTAGGSASAPIRVIGGQSFNPPPGDGTEHQELVPALYDGNPATYWNTEHYASANFGNLKPGVGVYLQLPAGSRPARLVVDSPDTGWRFSVYESSSPHPTLAGWGRPVASATQTLPSVTLSLPGAPADYVLVWITYLGDGNASVRVGEISPWS